MYTLRASKLGASAESLDTLAHHYELKRDFSKAAKCMALIQHYGTRGPLGTLLEQHPDHPAIVYYSFFHAWIKSGATRDPAFQLELKNIFLQLAVQNLENKPDEYTAFDELLAHEPWGDYAFIAYAVLGAEGNVQRNLLPAYSVLGEDGFAVFSKTLKDPVSPLSEEAKSAFLAAIALQGSIPRERTSVLLGNAPVTQKIHERKLYQAAKILRDLGDVGAIDTAAMIMEYAVNLSPSEIAGVKQIARDFHAHEARQAKGFFAPASASSSSAPAPAASEEKESEDKTQPRGPGGTGLDSPD